MRPVTGGLVTLGEVLATVGTSEPGPWSVGSALRLSFAGAEATVAIGVARLGHPACWIGRLGADPAGDLVLRGFRAEGLDVRRIIRDAEAPTALLLREQRTADRTVITYHRSDSAGSRLQAGDVDESVVDDAAWLHISGVTAGLGTAPLGALHRALDLAAARGVRASLDVNYRAQLWPRPVAASTLAALARRAQLVFGSPDELALLSIHGTTDVAVIAAELIEVGVGQVVSKDGARGATVFFPDASVGSGIGSVSLASRPVTVVDTVGAGDAFVAGYLSGELDRLTVRGKLARGILLGAVAVSTRGDWEGLPTRAELTELAGLAEADHDDVQR